MVTLNSVILLIYNERSTKHKSSVRDCAKLHYVAMYAFTLHLVSRRQTLCVRADCLWCVLLRYADCHILIDVYSIGYRLENGVVLSVK